MQTKLSVLLIFISLLIFVSASALFTVDETQQAIVLRLGQPTGDVRQPGIHIKIPMVEEVRYFDSRILSVDPEPEQVVISSSRDNPLINQGDSGGANSDSDGADSDTPIVAYTDESVSGEPIIVDTFARYRIVDPLQFMKKLKTVREANLRIENIMDDTTRSVLGRTSLKDLLSEERSHVMDEIMQQVNSKVEGDNLGIEIVDVRIIRSDLTPELRQSTVRRMISELKERATETRAKGEERALEIRSTAEKDRTVILAEARRDSQILRGEGDEQAIKIYSKAFNKDPEFYSFIRSLEAYRNSMSGSDTSLILSPEGKFFRFFDQK